MSPRTTSLRRTLAAAMFVSLLVPLSAIASFTQDLGYGAQGSAVAAVQTFLKERGFFAGDATGNYYGVTEAAVKAFQEKEGITPVSGYWGAKTRGVANTLLASSEGDVKGASTEFLVAAYNFDDGSGATLLDRSGKGNNGTINAGPTWTASGKTGSALTFNGTNGYVTVSDSATLDLSSGMTLEAWVYPTAAPASPTILLKENGSGLAYALRAHSDTNTPAGFATINGVELSVRGTSALPQNTWTHVATTFDGSNMRFYLNGALMGTNPASGSIAVSTGALRIGGNSIWGEFFAGRIDDVRIYNVALSQVDITEDMNTPVPSSPLPPAADTSAPTTPTGLTATVNSSSQITLNWTASTDAVGVTGYRVERCQGASCSTFAQIGTPPSTGSGQATYVDTGLTASTPYSYRIRATDAAGNLSGYSTTVSATTMAVGQSVISFTLINADTDADIQTITNGATINLSTLPTTNLNVRANTNPSTVGSVKFGLDGNANYVTESAAPYALFGDVSGNYNVGSFSLGSHTITATPYTSSGAGGTVGTALSLNFLVAYADTSAPTVSLTAPVSGATVSGSAVAVSANAADNVGVVGVQFKLDGVNLGTEDTSSPYSYIWNTTTAANGSHTLTAVARDAAGNTGTSPAVSVNVANSPDTTAPTTPTGLTATAVSSSAINLSWTPSTDAVGVTGYRVERCQGASCSTFAQIGTPATNSYSDSGLTASTQYSYRVRATDAAGNLSGYSSTVNRTTQDPPPPAVGLWSGILAPDRARDWLLAGIPGGIPSRTTVCANISAGASSATIQTAINNCPVGQVVLFGAGIFNVTGLYVNKGIVLRGQGPNSTTIVLSSNTIFLGAFGTSYLGGYPSSHTVTSWTGGLTRGSTVLTVGSTSGMSAGQAVILDELNPSWVFTSGQSGSQGSAGRGVGTAGDWFYGSTTRAAPQMTKIVSVNSGTQITIRDPVAYTHTSGLTPEVFTWTPNLQYAGVEDMRVDAVEHDHAIGLVHCDYCWVKNVRIDNVARSGVTTRYGYGMVLRDSYLSSALGGAPTQYGTECYMSSNVLIENNIFWNVTAPLQVQNCMGSVWAYNYVHSNVSGALFPQYDSHGAHNHFHLVEGNDIDRIQFDNVWGSSSHNTAFRNRANGLGENKTNYRAAIIVAAHNRHINLIGNVAGTIGHHIYYECSPSVNPGTDKYSFVWGPWNDCGSEPADSVVGTSLMRWGNWDVATYIANGNANGVRYCTASGAGNAACTADERAGGDATFPALASPSTTFPASFYLTAKPSWFGSVPWPAIGPDVTCSANCVPNAGSKANKIPARLCYEASAKDSNGYLTAYDPSTCYSDSTPPPTDITAPTTPTGLSATAVSSTGINLSWTASTDAVGVTGYRVERCQGASCSTFAQIGTPSTSSYTDAGLTASTQYSYRVRATDAAGNVSGYSSVASVTTQAPADTTAPTISTIAASSITQTSAIISWTTNENADTQVEYGQTTSYGQLTTLSASMVTSHSQSLTSLTPGTTYHYRVKSKDAAGNLAQSLDQTFTTVAAPDTQAPNGVTTLAKGTATETSVPLTWSAPSDLPGGGAVSAYDIRYMVGTISTSNWASALQATGEPAPGTPGTSHSYTLAGLTGGVTYTVAIRSTDAAGNLSALSNIATVTTTTPPPPADTTAPIISAITTSAVTTTGANISWTTNETSDTQVEYGVTTSYGQSTTLNTTLVTAHAQALSGLSSGTTYHYRVKSKDAAGNLTQSADLTFTTLLSPDTTVPTTPSSLSGVVNSATQVTVNWSASTDPTVAGQINSGIANYRIYRCTGTSCTATIEVGTASSTSFTSTGLTASTVYLFRIRAIDGAGNLSAYSDSVSVTTPTVPVVDTTPPILSSITAAGTPASLTVSWTTNEPADSVVRYGTSASSLTGVLTDLSLTTAHALTANNLTRRTTYYYQVVSKDAAGNTSMSTVGSFKTPRGKTASIVNLQAANGSVILSWTRPDDSYLASVRVYRSTSGYPTDTTGGALQATITDLSATSFRDNAVTSGTTYYYTLYTADDEGTLSDPAQVSFTPTAPASTPSTGSAGSPQAGSGQGGGGGGTTLLPVSTPSAPQALGAPDQIVLTWTNPTESTFVRTRVIRKAGSPPVDANDGTIIYEGTGKEFTDKKDLVQGQTYYYAIFALDQSLRASGIARTQARLGEKTEAQVLGALADLRASGATSTTITTAGGTTFTVILLKDLKLGMKDPEVVKLQDYLKKLGFFPPTETPTGYFGPLTQKAVIKYQQSKKIDPPAGFVGPTTRKIMGAGGLATPPPAGGVRSTRALLFGMEGNDVLLLQVKLKEKGYLPASITPNGTFGPATQAAVQKLQCEKIGICAGTPETTGYGLVGRMTRGTLGL